MQSVDLETRWDREMFMENEKRQNSRDAQYTSFRDEALSVQDIFETRQSQSRLESKYIWNFLPADVI